MLGKRAALNVSQIDLCFIFSQMELLMGLPDRVFHRVCRVHLGRCKVRVAIIVWTARISNRCSKDVPQRNGAGCEV